MADGRDTDEHETINPQRPRFKIASAADFEAFSEELDLAWAQLTDAERSQIDAELAAKRRAKNPLWPWVTSDHVDRLSERLHRNTVATNRLESALTEPEWGLNMKVRALTSAVDSLRDICVELRDTVRQLSEHFEARPA